MYHYGFKLKQITNQKGGECTLQIYTHAAIGLGVGMMVAPHNAPVQAACVIGSCLPDITIAPFYTIDRLKGGVPSFASWPRALIICELAHSLPFWMTMLLLGAISRLVWGNPFLAAWSLGVLSHIIIDAPTHGGRAINHYAAADNLGFLWPWKFKLGKILGFYEYRDLDYPGLLPKWPETIFLGAIFAVIIWVRIG